MLRSPASLREGRLEVVLDDLVQDTFFGFMLARQLRDHRCPDDSFGKTVLQTVSASFSSVTAAKQAIDTQIAKMETL